MSSPAGSGWLWRRAAALVLLTAGTLLALPSEASTGVELTPATKRTLARLQEQWLRWLGESYQDREGEQVTVEEMLAAVESLGFQSVPELGRGAAARGLAAIREGNLAMARRALVTAERLAPGLPETAFVEAELARAEARHSDRFKAWSLGWLRTLRQPGALVLAGLNLGLWLAAGILVAGALFVILLAATRGSTIVLRLVEVLSAGVPRPLAVVLAVAVLLWPLLVPPLGLWLLPWWSVLVWSHTATNERVVLVVVWLVVGLVPLALSTQHHFASTRVDPIERLLGAIERGELVGSLGTDLDELADRLPSDPATTHLLADVHRRLGQWDLAARHLRQVVENEPSNAPALVDLGAFAFRKGDYGAAVQFFQMATVADPDYGLAWYDLSQAYSEAYQFDAQRQALEQARRLDPERVADWIQDPPDERVALAGGGIARSDEVRAKWRSLEATSAEVASPEAGPTPEASAARDSTRGKAGISPWFSLAVPLILSILAFATARLLRPFDVPLEEGFTWRQGLGWRLVRVFLPGLPSAEVAEGPAAFGALLVPVLVGLAAFGTQIGSAFPLGVDRGDVHMPFVLAALALVFVGRFVWDLRTEG